MAMLSHSKGFTCTKAVPATMPTYTPELAWIQVPFCSTDITEVVSAVVASRVEANNQHMQYSISEVAWRSHAEVRGGRGGCALPHVVASVPALYNIATLSAHLAIFGGSFDSCRSFEIHCSSLGPGPMPLQAADQVSGGKQMGSVDHASQKLLGATRSWREDIHRPCALVARPESLLDAFAAPMVTALECDHLFGRALVAADLLTQVRV